MKIIRFFAVMAIFVSIVACKETKKDSKTTTEVEYKTQTKQQIATTEKEGDWKTYSDKIFSVQYPSNWVIKVPETNSEFQIFSPKESEKDMFIENCNATLESVAEFPDIDTDSYIEFSLKDVKEMFPDLKILKEGEVVNGNDTYKMISYKGNFSGTEMIIKQYVTIKNKTAYVFTETLAASNYEGYEKIMDKIFSTFKIK